MDQQTKVIDRLRRGIKSPPPEHPQSAAFSSCLDVDPKAGEVEELFYDVDT